jgi:hypothetical protein
MSTIDKVVEFLFTSPWISRGMLVSIVGVLMLGFYKTVGLLIKGKLDSMKVENAAQKAAVVSLGEQHTIIINELVTQRTNCLRTLQESNQHILEGVTKTNELLEKMLIGQAEQTGYQKGSFDAIKVVPKVLKRVVPLKKK